MQPGGQEPQGAISSPSCTEVLRLQFAVMVASAPGHIRTELRISGFTEIRISEDPDKASIWSENASYQVCKVLSKSTRKKVVFIDVDFFIYLLPHGVPFLIFSNHYLLESQDAARNIKMQWPSDMVAAGWTRASRRDFFTRLC